MKANLSYWEIEELAAAMLGKTEEYENESLENLDELFYDAFDIDTSQLHKLVEHLLPMIDAGQSITGCMHKGFAQDGCFIVKVDV